MAATNAMIDDELSKHNGKHHNYHLFWSKQHRHTTLCNPTPTVTAKHRLVQASCFCEQQTHKYSTYEIAQSCTARSHITTRTRVAQELQSSGLHIFVSLKQLSSTCHVSFFAARDTDHKHKFSLTHFIHFSFPTVSLLQTSPMILDPYIPCDVPRQSGGSTQIPSLTVSWAGVRRLCTHAF